MIDEELQARLRVALSPLSETLFKSLLRESGYPLDPLVEGVRQDNLEELERTLIALAKVYENAALEGRKKIRTCVIQAKDHARLVARNSRVDPAKRASKREMMLWMLTWLENPAVFETWVQLRKQVIAVQSPSLG
ncbi:MAG: hypothetical protein NZV14_14285 [Bryobacteraceae bacterium]|nr:hypothetical protein [Bryobacteraceae bacterium]MDW8379330.1 hypothetical protein [Bryobacterales bacterium]